MANCLYKETGKITVIVVDGIDHAARSGKKNTFLKTLPSPNRLPDGVVFLLAGQPYSNNPEYPLWLDGNDVITKAVPALESDDIKQLLTDSNISFGDATVEEIAEYIFSVTKGNTLSVMYAVYDAKGHDSICNYEKYITDRNLANGIDAYYDYIWQSAMGKWDDSYKHVEIVLSGAMILLNRGITIELLQTLLKDLTKITDIQLVCWMQGIEPLIIENGKLSISKRRIFCQPVQIDNVIRVIESNKGITFLTTDNENGVFASIDNNGVCGRFVHSELEIKIVVHGSLLPKDI